MDTIKADDGVVRVVTDSELCEFTCDESHKRRGTGNQHSLQFHVAVPWATAKEYVAAGLKMMLTIGTKDGLRGVDLAELATAEGVVKITVTPTEFKATSKRGGDRILLTPGKRGARTVSPEKAANVVQTMLARLNREVSEGQKSREQAVKELSSYGMAFLSDLLD